MTPAELAERSARVAVRLREHPPMTPLLRFAALSEVRRRSARLAGAAR